MSSREPKDIDAASTTKVVARTLGAVSKCHPYLEAMWSTTPDLMIAIDKDFHVLDLNAAVVAALGWSPDNTIGRRCSDVLKCRNLNRMQLCGTSSCPLMRVLNAKTPLINEELIIGAVVEPSREVSLTVVPVELDGEIVVVFSARDIASLKVANRVRANFVSMVSHELRTPLNSVQGFIDLILQGHMGALNEEQQTYLGYAQEGVQQLMTIVEDILFMTRSDSGQFEIKSQEMNFRVVAKQVVNSLQPQAFKAGVVLTKDIPVPSPQLFADPQRMKQVLNNLVANAIKFTPPTGTVTIRARPYNERFVMISVIDTGLGIAPEDQQHIFERFYQSSNNRQSKIGGYGLGLAIAKLIVEQHGGEIGFDTVPEKGTTFYFTVPMYTGQAM